MIKPQYIDPKIEQVFSDYIVQPFQNPGLFDPELLPVDRLFLFYGQQGIGTSSMLESLCAKYKLRYSIMTITKNSEDFLEQFLKFKEKPENVAPILILRKGYNLKFHREPRVLDLRANIKSHYFILVEDIDKPEDGPFYEQFKRRIVVNLPEKDFYISLLKYYFTRWANHWKETKVNLSEEDVDKLGLFSSYCTPSDVKKFCQSIFDKIRKNPAELDMNFVESNKLLFEPFGIPKVYCIADKDGKMIQGMFDVGFNDNGLSYEESLKRSDRKKRSRTTEPDGGELSMGI